MKGYIPFGITIIFLLMIPIFGYLTPQIRNMRFEHDFNNYKLVVDYIHDHSDNLTNDFNKNLHFPQNQLSTHNIWARKTTNGEILIVFFKTSGLVMTRWKGYIYVSSNKLDDYTTQHFKHLKPVKSNWYSFSN